MAQGMLAAAEHGKHSAPVPEPEVPMQNEAASCASINCAANALTTTAKNPHEIIGAVVEFATFSDSYKVSRPPTTPPSV